MIDLSKRFRDIVFEKKGRDKKENKKKEKKRPNRNNILSIWNGWP